MHELKTHGELLPGGEPAPGGAPGMSLVPTDPRWVAAALADLPTLLLDHAHCEKKAAGTALKLISRYPDHTRLVPQLSRLMREEMVHFERVLAELATRGVAFRALHSAGYAAALFAQLRRASVTDRFVDEMLICAIIEARSHERFLLLAAAARASDPRLASLYEDLCEAEARHGNLYLDLVRDAAPADAIAARLAELTAHEAAFLAQPKQALRMHSGAP